ncbi:uncharacterized protein LOC133830890 [Humulus lupulus]|uniref:uncharacterized protein LOC133830890 n=1 Tax=Humulus lupulus TaxID=3486 RepID=UPI002B414BBC|nr:uncharacterized protein LOC133830890 [Humulus lupulus]XP_062116981.1 uncharacterized protein LOC133830890 [Humulus lupulus]
MKEERVNGEQLELAKKRCRNVIESVSSISTNKITPSSQRTLLKLARSELAFLSRSSFSLHTLRSVNIGHIEAVVHILQQPFVTGVSRVCKSISVSSISGQKTADVVYVDIVCTLNRNPVWIIVSDRNPKYISWNESHSSKGLKFRIEKLLAVARSSVALKPSSVILFFSNGLSGVIYEKLREEFGAAEFGLEFTVFDCDFSEDLEQDWVNVLARTYREASVLEIRVNPTKDDGVSNLDCAEDTLLLEAAEQQQGFTKDQMVRERDDSFLNLISRMTFLSSEAKNADSNTPRILLQECEYINFDTTPLIAVVSEISNGGCEKLLVTPEAELREKYKGNYEFVIGQVMSEIQNPIHVDLGSVISGKRGMICQSVCSEFKELVSMCGGPNEKFRADLLLRCLKVVADCPSERMMSLPTTRKLAMKNKIVFGTGDYWHAPTLTANMAFVRAISQTGMSLFTIGHRPRALTGD